MAVPASGAVGERSVSVAGDVVGSLIITGDKNNVNLVVGSQHGALMEQLARGHSPSKRLRPGPVRSVPPQFGDSLDREEEVRAILQALGARTPVNVHGPRGIGKTYALLSGLNGDDPALGDGAVYLYAPGPLDDVLQLLFEAWFECEPPFKPSNPQLRRDLAQIGGLAALDSVELERDAAQQVLLAAPGCRVVISSRERVLMEGASVAVHGLGLQFALVLVERELGRPLEHAEREHAERICTALEGHPLKIREAVASAQDAGRSLAELASELGAGNPDAALSRDKLEAAGEDGRRLLAALALFGDATVGKDHLRAIAGVDNFEQALTAALERGDLHAHSPRYDLGVTLDAVVPAADLAAPGSRALAHFTGWAEANRARPAVLMTEARALIALLRWAVDSGRVHEAIRLGRAIDHAFTLERRFGGWGQVLDQVHAAALAAGDREAEAWALHQLGTRMVCLGDLAGGIATLSQAMSLRRELGDKAGARTTARNLSIATHPRWFWRWVAGHSLLVGLVLAVLAAGAVAAATLPGSSNNSLVSKNAPISNSASPSQPVRTNGQAPTTQGGAGSATTTLSVVVTGSGSVATAPVEHKCFGSCTIAVDRGSTLTLAATPEQGFVFAGWAGACSGTGPCTLPMAADRDVTANFTRGVPLTVIPSGVSVTSDKGNIRCPTACSDTYSPQTTLVLTADQPAFWTGAPACPAPPGSQGANRPPVTRPPVTTPTTTTTTPPPTTTPPAAKTPPVTTTPPPGAGDQGTTGPPPGAVGEVSSRSGSLPVSVRVAAAAPPSSTCVITLDQPRTVSVETAAR